jgi:hypothetical protein
VNVDLGVVEVLVACDPDEGVHGLVHGNGCRAGREDELRALLLPFPVLGLPVVESDWRR